MSTDSHAPGAGPAAAGAVVGVVVVDHGSRRDEANLRHQAFVEEWRRRAPYALVESAHMELAEPSIGTAFDACVAAGATTVVIAPFFLWPGDHWDRDIPTLAAQAASAASRSPLPGGRTVGPARPPR